MRPLRGILICCILGSSLAALSADNPMAAIDGASFTMGSQDHNIDERPTHVVTLDPYSIDKHEVSYHEYSQCVQEKKCSPAHYDDGRCMIWTGSAFKQVTVPHSLRSPDIPVVCVTWQQAQEYCRAHGKQLPTEAQWEYAASTGKTTLYSWGNQPPEKTRCTQPANNAPKKCGNFAGNSFGLYDMTGNVWEWTNDRYQRDYYSVSESHNPRGSPAGIYRVVRGGGWYSGAEQLRITNRYWFEQSHCEVSIGFRCAR